LRNETARGFRGADGSEAGTIGKDLDEAAESPLAFVAMTVNVYEVPFVRPVTVHEVSLVVEQFDDPGFAVTV
jgi:hypothetical protein